MSQFVLEATGIIHCYRDNERRTWQIYQKTQYMCIQVLSDSVIQPAANFLIPPSGIILPRLN
jgi:hypothetical protein